MGETVSVATMISRLAGMLGTDDLSNWEEGFISNIVEITENDYTLSLSSKQVDKIESIFNKHFAG